LILLIVPKLRNYDKNTLQWAKNADCQALYAKICRKRYAIWQWLLLTINRKFHMADSLYISSLGAFIHHVLLSRAYLCVS